MSLAQSIDVEEYSAPDKAVRNRLDLVLLMSDVLHTAKFHKSIAIQVELQPFVKQLVALVAICCHEKNSKHERRLKAVVKFWFINSLFTTEDISDIMESVRAGFHRARDHTLPPPRSINDNLPAYFGGSNVTDHDLPAAYVLTRELYMDRRGEPAGIKSQRLPRQPTRKTTDILDAYFQKLDEIYRPTADNPLGAVGGYRQWTDATGHQIAQHKTTSSTRKITNGLGWSIDMCKQMQERGRVQKVFKAEAGLCGRDLDGHRGDANGRQGHYDSDHSRSRSRTRRRREHSSSDSEYGRRERRRDRSGSHSSYDSRRGRSSSRRDDREHQKGPSRSRYDEYNRDEDPRRLRGTGKKTDNYKQPPALNSHQRNNPPPPPPPPQPNTAPPNFPLQPPHFPENFQPQFPPNQPPGSMGSGAFPGQFAPPFTGPPSGHFQPPMTGQFPNQYPGQFPTPPFPPHFPSASSPPPHGPPNWTGYPNAFPLVGGPGFPAQQGGNSNFGQQPGHGGYNPGGFQGNFPCGGGNYGGSNHGGRGGGGSGWR